MIVLLIIAVVYGLLVQKLTFASDKNDTLSLQNIPTFMQKNFANLKAKVTLRCVNECFTCKFFVGKKELSGEFNLFKKHSILDVYDTKNFENITFLDFLNEDKKQEVCFEYNLYENASSDEMVLKYEDKFYMYGNFGARVFDSLSEVEKYVDEQKQIFKDEL